LVDSILIATTRRYGSGASAVTFGEPATDPFGLTRRERQVLDLVVRGLANRQIAERLGLSGKTISNNVSTILAKMGSTTAWRPQHALVSYSGCGGATADPKGPGRRSARIREEPNAHGD
jgi:DNA-binding NarL/FixJ family response regulator